MMKIEVNTTSATLIPPRESLTPGSVNAVQLKFTFSDEWNGLTKTCVFSNEIETVPAEMQNDSTAVPTDVLDEVYRWISVGVSGEDADGTVIIPTIWCRIGQCLPGVSGRFVTIDMLQAYWSKQEVMFELDGDGTKFFGNDGLYHFVAQGGGDVTHEQLDAALALKADKDAFDALTTTVDGKADKSEIITVTTGDGTKYLADDGTYKTITGGGDVTHDELNAAIAPLATKAELADAVKPLATKTELANATTGLATTAAMNAALALKADKTELDSYARQDDMNQALATKADKTELANYATKSEIITVTDGDGTQFLANDGTYKRVQTDLSSYLTKTEAEQTYATQTEVADKANKSEIITVTTGTGTLFLADDGTYKPAAGDPPDLSAYLTKTEAGTTYETQVHASATYATKVELPDTSDMLTKTEAASTYATQSELSDKADTTTVNALDTRVTANEGAITALQNDKADASALADYETTAHAAATYATKAELPDTSDMLTKTEAESRYATIEAHNTLALRVVATESEISAMKSENYVPSATAEATYAKKDEIITVTTGTGTLFLADDGTYKPAAGDPPDLSAYLTKTEAGTTYATQTALTEGLATKVDTATLADYETTAHASATYATKAEIPDVTGFETTAHAEATYATKTELANKADASSVDSALALKADKTELASYETAEHASATYATKTELTEGLAGKVDTVDIADMLTKTEAEGTYADKASLLTLENTVEAQGARITNLETNKADKTEIITVTNGTGTLFLADDGTYKPAAGDPPDLSAYLTKTEAGTTYATQTALTEGLAGKVDIATLADYETSAHASATYATKAELPDVSDMLTKTEAGTTYATKTELADKADSATVTALSGVVTGHTAEISALQTGKADKSEIPDVSSFETTVHAEATYATKAELPDVSDMLTKTEAGTTYATQTALTEGLAGKVDTATLADYETTAHASATYATKAELPDVSDMLTKTEAGATYETQTHAEQTYLKKDDASEIKTIKSAKHTVTVDNGVADIGGTTVSRDDSQTSTNAYSVVTVKQNLPATADATGDEGASFVISKAGTLQGVWQNISIDGVNVLTSYEFNYRLNGLLSSSEAESTYLKIADAAATYQTIADASPIKSITDGTIALTPDANGNVKVGRTAVRYLSLGTNPPYTNHGVVISEDAPAGAGAGEGAAFGFSYQTDGTELTEAKVAMGDATSLTYMDLPTKKWVRDYIASLDGNNIGY